MPKLKRYRIFVSHAWRYHTEYSKLVSLLDQALLFEYSNYSVPQAKRFEGMNRSQLREQLGWQIRPVECFLALGGLYVSYSDWIQFEINFAKRLDKPIIGLRPWGAQKMPRAVTDAANEVVGWNTASIVEAIRRYAI